MESNPPKLRGGLSLIEVLVSIAIIAVLLTLLLPALGRSKEKSKNTKCQGNLRQLYLIITAYADDHQAAVPFTQYHVENHPALLVCPSDTLFSQRTNPPASPPTSYHFNTSWSLKELPPNGWLAQELLPWHDPKAVMPDRAKGIDRPSGHHNQLQASGQVIPVLLGDETLTKDSN